jgi:Cu2+-exporting ATPase
VSDTLVGLRAQCPHCGAPVEARNDEFCCHGCELAWSIIHGAGLERYYEDREAYAPRPEPNRQSWEAVPTRTTPDGKACISVMIDGMRCASCVWVTERVLERMPGVHNATVSYATGRAHLEWDPERINLGALADRIAALGYRPRLLGEEAPPDRELLPRLGLATFAAMNIMLISVSVYAGWFTSMAPRFHVFFQWASLVLATPVAFWAAEPFYRGAWSGLKNGVLHMDVPIALAIAVLYVHGLAVTIAGTGEAYLDSLTMLVALLLGGRMLESRGRRRAAEAATALAATAPSTARRRTRDGFATVPADQLLPGDLIDLGSGQDVPADGFVTEGAGQVTMALITGEAAPIPVGPNDRLVAGAVVEDGALTMCVESAGENTVLGRMATQLRTAADRGIRPSPTDRIAPWFTAATLVVATVTFVSWWAAADAGAALIASVAVLVVACPCALALSRPLGAAAGLGAAARRGLMLRSADALMEMADVDMVALDKTGTVTAGALEVVAARDEDLRIASGLERYSVHPVARAITAEATRRGIPIPRGRDVRETAGVGIQGYVDDHHWRLSAGEPGAVVLESGDGDRRTIWLGDVLRTDTPEAIRTLGDLGATVVLLTGDQASVSQRMGRAAGIEAIVSDVDPDDKRKWIAERKSERHRVLFAGDGINDGPGLAEATVGIAMGTGAASSVLIADGIVARGSLNALVAGIRTGRACRAAIRANQVRSIGYNVLAVAAASVGWINPLVAAILMPLSSAMVIWGSSRVEARVAREEVV